MSKCKYLNKHKTETLILSSKRRDIILIIWTSDNFPVTKDIFLKGTADEKAIQFSNNICAAKEEEHQVGQEKAERNHPKTVEVPYSYSEQSRPCQHSCPRLETLWSTSPPRKSLHHLNHCHWRSHLL